MKTLIFALRFLSRAKSYTVISLLSLSFSLAGCIVLTRYIHHELTVDVNCVDRNDVYAVQVDIEGNRYYGSFEVYQDSILFDPAVVSAHCQMIPLENDYVVCDGRRFRCNAIATDSTFFHLFTYQTVQGENWSDDPFSVILTEDYAHELFGTLNPIGRSLRFSNGGNYVVKGVVAMPENKTWINFDMAVPHTSSNRWQRMPLDFYRFVPGTDLDQINAIGNIPRRVSPDFPNDTRRYTFHFVPIKDCYWTDAKISAETSVFAWGNRQQLRIFIGVCAMLLIMGMLNFINLYMMFMLKRTHEYGIRRILGADRLQIFLHILTENFLLVAAAVFFAWTIVELVQEPASRLFGFDFAYGTFDWQMTLFLLLVLPLSASLWPYYRFIHDVPSVSINTVSTTHRSVRSRMILLFGQYVVTFLLVILALYFNRQLNMLVHTDPGYRTDNILVANLVYESNDYAVYRDEEAMQEKRSRTMQIAEMVDRCPDIDCWIVDDATLNSSGYANEFKGNDGRTAFLNVWYADPDFFRLYDLRFVEGGLPDTGYDRGKYYVVNRAGLKALGYESCKGATIVDESDNMEACPITGVIEDYYDGHVTAGIHPMVFIVYKRTSGCVYQMSVQPGRMTAVLDYLKSVQREVYGTEEFEYYLFADKVKQMYEADRQTATLYGLFAGIAIVVSCLGLFAISLFDIRQRYREIAIRKVNGAGRKDLYRLLFRKYLLMLGGAFIITLPLSFYIVGVYTEGFIKKVSLTADMFIASLAVVGLISLATLFWQINRAARINPAEVIKGE